MSRERILVLCRAIPEESRSFFNTVCVAGITDKGEWRRLYPVPFKPFVKGAGIPFHKKDWMDVDTRKPKPTDKRIESRRIDYSSIQVIGRATEEHIREFIAPFVKPSIKAINESGASLGLIKPRILEYDCKVIDVEEWDKDQVDLHGNPKGKVKLSQVSTYKFVCEDHTKCSCRKNLHEMEVRDWEINELYRNIIRKTKNPNLIRLKMKEKWFGWMGKRETYFVMGIHFKYNTWMIISVLYLRKPTNQALTRFIEDSLKHSLTSEFKQITFYHSKKMIM